MGAGLLIGAGQAASNRSQLGAIVEYSEDAIFSMALDGRIRTWNAGAETFYGYSAAEVIERNFADLVQGGCGEAEILLAKTRRGEAVTRYDAVAVRKDATTLHAALTLSPIRDEAGNVVNVSAISRDITERKRLETELQKQNVALEEQYRTVQETNRLKSEFLANMSHELRTPLNAVIGFAQLMRDGKVGAVSAEHQEYLGDILSSGRHLLELINDVLDLAKVESGKMQFNAEPAELSALVQQVQQLLKNLITKRRQTVHVQISPEVEEVVIDTAKFKQVLYNFVSNAIKFTPEGGNISIRAVADDAAHFRIEVEDNGIGIPADRIGELFVEFRQLDQGSGKRHQGSGLGLALVKKLVEAQGGRVGVRSEFGHGSVFFAIFPKGTPMLAEESSPAIQDVPHGAEPRILVIEDDDNDRLWLQQTLESAGYVVDSAASGAEGIAKAQLATYAAVLLDLILPDTLGWEVLQAIRRSTLNESAPIIVTTVVEEKSAAKEFALQDYLIKPFSAAALLTALRRAGVIGTGCGKRILVVDADPRTLDLAGAALDSSGYQSSCHADAESALAAAAQNEIDAVVFDLTLPQVDGFEFLDRLRKLTNCKTTPAIVWTAKNISTDERERLNRSADSITHKDHGGIDAVLRELRYHVRPSADAPSREHA